MHHFVFDFVFGSLIDSLFSSMSWGSWFLFMTVIGVGGCLLFCGA